MLTTKKKFIFSIVVLCCFSLLSTGLIQPIQTAQALSDAAKYDAKLVEALDSLHLDIQQSSENQFIITAGNVTTILDITENGHSVSVVIDNETLTYDVTNEMLPTANPALGRVSENSDIMQRVVRVNGTELDVSSIEKIVQSQSVEDPDEPSPTRVRPPYATYWWDGVLFEEGYDGNVCPAIDIGYPHPIKGNYSISIFEDGYIIGNDLIHYQFDHTTSQLLLTLGAGVFGLVVGYALGTLIGALATIVIAGIGAVPGGLIGAVIGLVLAELATWWSHSTYLDEADCIWLWFDKYMPSSMSGWIQYLSLYEVALFEIYHIEWIIGQLEYSNNYLRMGTKTYINGLGMSDPAPPPLHYYATSATKSNTGNGYVNDLGFILGPIDQSYAYLNSGSYLNKDEITATVSSTPASGTLYLQCYTPSANGANLKVYVCGTSGTWTQVKNTNLYPANTPMAVNCGYVSNILKVSIVAYHEYSGYPSYIYVDAVVVISQY